MTALERGVSDIRWTLRIVCILLGVLVLYMYRVEQKVDTNRVYIDTHTHTYSQHGGD